MTIISHADAVALTKNPPKFPMNPYRLDAEACGRAVREIILKRKPKVWRHLSSDDELAYVAWASRWAFHWAVKAGA